MTGEYPSLYLHSFHGAGECVGARGCRAGLSRGMWLRLNDETPLEDVMKSEAGAAVMGDGPFILSGRKCSGARIRISRVGSSPPSRVRGRPALLRCLTPTRAGSRAAAIAALSSRRSLRINGRNWTGPLGCCVPVAGL